MLGEALRLIRVFHDVKLTELAATIGVSAGYLSEVENGKKPATIELVQLYAKEFGVPASAIMFFSEDLDPKSAKSKVKAKIRTNMLKFLKAVERGADQNP